MSAGPPFALCLDPTFPGSREYRSPCPLTQSPVRSGVNLGTSAESQVTCVLLVVAKTGTHLTSGRRTRVTNRGVLDGYRWSCFNGNNVRKRSH